jgi:hypothetical protein
MQPLFGLRLISSRTDAGRSDGGLSVRLCSDSCDDQGCFQGMQIVCMTALIGGQGS